MITNPRASDLATLSPLSWESLGHLWTGSEASAVWPAANTALLFPQRITRRLLVTAMWVYNGSTASGNIDMGIYDIQGNLIVTKGSTAQSGTSAIQQLDITDTWLAPGLYYLAIVMDNTTGTTRRVTANAEALRGVGCAQMASAFALPSPVVPAVMAQAYVPMFGALVRRTTL